MLFIESQYYKPLFVLWAGTKNDLPINATNIFLSSVM
jgi:hypothetical protein